MGVTRATAADYEFLLLSHRPRGPAWPEEDALLAALAEEFARIHNRLMDLLRKPTHARRPSCCRLGTALGLPDPCHTTPPTIQARRDAVVQKLVNVGGQTPAFFVDLAARIGYTITVTEFRPHTCEHDCEHGVYDDPWAFAWQVVAPLDTIRDSTCEDSCEDPLRTWGNEVLECTLRRYQPAHTRLHFSYIGFLSLGDPYATCSATHRGRPTTRAAGGRRCSRLLHRWQSANGQPATVPGYEWYNRVQEELCHVIEQAGLALSNRPDPTAPGNYRDDFQQTLAWSRLGGILARIGEYWMATKRFNRTPAPRGYPSLRTITARASSAPTRRNACTSATTVFWSPDAWSSAPHRRRDRQPTRQHRYSFRRR